MARLLSRTSITIDEAVSILLGRSTGPIDFEPMDGAEDAEANAPVFCLFETLEDELEVLTGEYEIAKYEKQPADVIAEKQAAVQHQEAVREQAYQHLCEINDELNKGEQSALKMDTALSNAACRFITLHSFNQWRASSAGEQPVAVLPTESVPPSTEGTEQKVVRDKGIRQGKAILAEIKKQGFDPKAMPPSHSGRRGVKAAVRAALKDPSLFKGSKMFDRAWQKLRNDDDIVNESDPPPHK